MLLGGRLHRKPSGQSRRELKGYWLTWLDLWPLWWRQCRHALAAHSADDTFPLMGLLSIASLQWSLYPCRHSRRKYCLSISFLVGRLVKFYELCRVEEHMDFFLAAFLIRVQDTVTLLLYHSLYSSSFCTSILRIWSRPVMPQLLQSTAMSKTQISVYVPLLVFMLHCCTVEQTAPEIGTVLFWYLLWFSLTSRHHLNSWLLQSPDAIPILLATYLSYEESADNTPTKYTKLSDCFNSLVVNLMPICCSSFPITALQFQSCWLLRPNLLLAACKWSTKSNQINLNLCLCHL